MPIDTGYPGTELEITRDALHWKRYWSRLLKPYMRGRVLEVGCGLGANAAHLITPAVESWTFLEPDERLLAQVPAHVHDRRLREGRRLIGTTADLAPGERFDTILYIDVIEHVADDRAELLRALALLEPGGHLLLLAPAFAHLFGPFDRAIGHFRRYDRRTMRAALPADLRVVRSAYLDAMGYFLALGNRWILRSPRLRRSHVLFWDRCMVPLSRVIDPLLAHPFGKSLVVAARNERKGGG